MNFIIGFNSEFITKIKVINKMTEKIEPEVDQDKKIQIDIDPKIFQKLEKLSNVTGIPKNDIVSGQMKDFFYSVGDIPVIFLDRHLGIKNIKNPIEMLEKMKDIINIPPAYLEELKTKDLVKHVENWHNPLKKTN